MNDSKIEVEQVLINGYPHLKGEFVYFQSEPFFSLNVGDKINRIGDGRQNGTYRTLHIEPYMTYVGSYFPFNENTKCYCFLLPKGGVTGWDLFNPEVPVYSCFVDLDNTLVGLQNYGRNVCYAYIPDFGIVG